MSEVDILRHIFDIGRGKIVKTCSSPKLGIRALDQELLLPVSDVLLHRVDLIVFRNRRVEALTGPLDITFGGALQMWESAIHNVILSQTFLLGVVHVRPCSVVIVNNDIFGLGIFDG